MAHRVAKTKTECQKLLRQAMADADKGLVFDAGTQTLDEYLSRWLEGPVKGSVKPVTYQSYERLVRVNLTLALGRMKLVKLSPAHLQGLYRSKLDTGLSPRAVQYTTWSCTGHSNKPYGGNWCRAT